MSMHFFLSSYLWTAYNGSSVFCIEIGTTTRPRLCMQAFEIFHKWFRGTTIPRLFFDLGAKWFYGGAPNCTLRLQELGQGTLLVSRIRSFSFHFRCYNTDHIWDVADELLDALQRLKKLNKLTLTLPKDEAAIFERNYNRTNLELRSITTLVVGPFCEFIIRLCPAVTQVAFEHEGHASAVTVGETADRRVCSLLGAVRKLPDVKHFEVSLPNWSETKKLELIRQCLPKLESLVIAVDLLPSCCPAGNLSSLFTHLRQCLAPSLMSFPHLQYVDIGPHLRLWTQEYNQQIVTEPKLVSELFEGCGNLKCLWMGNESKLMLKRDEHGLWMVERWERGVQLDRLSVR